MRLMGTVCGLAQDDGHVLRGRIDVPKHFFIDQSSTTDLSEMLKTLTKTFEPPHSGCQCCTAESTVVYIAAPYSHPDPVENTHAVIKIADAVLEAGFIPVLPHLTLLWHLVSPKPYITWIGYDRELLKRCDLVLRVPGHSPGATDQCLLATALNIPVILPRSANPTDCVAALTQFFSN